MNKNHSKVQISASLVLYENNPSSILKVLDSINFNSDLYFLKLVIVDNSVNKCKIDFSKFKNFKITYIKNKKNIGFSKAHNIAIRHSVGEKYHIILNPDIWFNKDTIEKLYLYKITQLQKSPLISGMLLSKDGTIQACDRKDPSLINLFFRRFFHESFISAIFDDNYVIPEKKFIVTDNLSGAFMFADKEILLKVDCFDERFFLYMEDFDLSRRMRKFGELQIISDIEIYHKRARGSYTSLNLFWIHVFSLFKYFLKWNTKENFLNKKISKKKLIIFSTSGFIINNFFNEHIKALSSQYRLRILTPLHSFPKAPNNKISYGCINFNIQRKISLLNDFYSFLCLVFYSIFNRNDMVISLGPKAGLIGGLAGMITFIKKRVFIFQGQVWSNKKGIFRFILLNFDRLISLTNTNLLSVSKNECDFLINNNICNKQKIRVLGFGSICGVDINSYNKYLSSVNSRKKDICFSFGFIGRMNYEKGILDLVNAFKIISNKYKNIKLIFAGIDEVNFINFIKYEKKITHLNYQDDPRIFLSLIDCLVLPSYREGMPITILESFASKIPVLGTDIYGITSVIKHNETGLLSPPGNIKSLAENMETIINNKPLAKKIVNNAYIMVNDKFNQDFVVKNYINYFNKIMET